MGEHNRDVPRALLYLRTPDTLLSSGMVGRIDAGVLFTLSGMYGFLETAMFVASAVARPTIEELEYVQAAAYRSRDGDMWNLTQKYKDAYRADGA